MGSAVQVLFFVVLLLPIGIWMLSNGLSEGVGIRIAIGVTLLFVAVVVGGACIFSFLRAKRRGRDRLRQGMAGEAGLPGMVGGHHGPGRKPYCGDNDAAGEGGIDLDVGGID